MPNVNISFSEDDFTEDELMLLRLAFGLVDVAVESARRDNYDVDRSNALYDLKHKLGVYEIVG